MEWEEVLSIIKTQMTMTCESGHAPHIVAEYVDPEKYGEFIRTGVSIGIEFWGSVSDYNTAPTMDLWLSVAPAALEKCAKKDFRPRHDEIGLKYTARVRLKDTYAWNMMSVVNQWTKYYMVLLAEALFIAEEFIPRSDNWTTVMYFSTEGEKLPPICSGEPALEGEYEYNA